MSFYLQDNYPIYYIYQVEVSKIHRVEHLGINPDGTRSIKALADPKVYTISYSAPDAITALINLIDMGYTPVKVLNPQIHD